MIADSYLGWYLQEMGFVDPLLGMGLPFPLGTIMTMILVLFINLIAVRFALAVVPFLDKILSKLCYPFWFMHIHAHIQTAVDLRREIENSKGTVEVFETPDTKRNVYVGSFNTMSLGDQNESSRISVSAATIADMVKIAFAPLNYGIIMLVIFFITMPFMRQVGFVGFIIQMYFSVAIFGYLLPSNDDVRMVYHTVLRAGLIPRRFVTWTFGILFITLFLVTMQTEGEVWIGLIWALGFALIYIFMLIFLSQKWGGKQKLQMSLMIELDKEKKGGKKPDVYLSDEEAAAFDASMEDIGGI